MPGRLPKGRSIFEGRARAGANLSDDVNSPGARGDQEHSHFRNPISMQTRYSWSVVACQPLKDNGGLVGFREAAQERVFVGALFDGFSKCRLVVSAIILLNNIM